MKEKFHINSNTPRDEYLIPTVLTFNPPEGITLDEVAYPEHILLKTGGLDEDLAVYENAFTMGAALSLDGGLAEGDYTIPGSLRYQACNEKACFMPRNMAVEFAVSVVPESQALELTEPELFASIDFKRGSAPASEVVEDKAVKAVECGGSLDVLVKLDGFDILGTKGGLMKSDGFAAFIDAAESGEEQAGMLDGYGVFGIIIAVLIGGLTLNLTPCVLPMIPINLAIIGAGSQAGSRARGAALGGAYGVAMALVYGTLGLIVVLTDSTFGAINQSPWFNFGIALIFFPLALAMFDIINIDFSKLQAKLNFGRKGKGTFILAFGMGGVAALLAGACVAPAVIAVVVFSADLYAKGNPIALALPFLLGIGMALPWPVAGAGLSFMPKPGAWMVRVKQAFGLFILGFAGYYGYLGYEILSVNQEEVASGVEGLLEEGWYASMEDGLDAAVAEDKLVLVDMWAKWCKNCLVMDKTTFQDKEILAKLDDYVKIKYQAEQTAKSPAKDVLERFDGLGLPHYAILRPKS
jgi:cytochrome c biogenesis protein CcdA/thiol-disulfide isomerase/thioredoxin